MSLFTFPRVVLGVSLGACGWVTTLAFGRARCWWLERVGVGDMARVPSSPGEHDSMCPQSRLEPAVSPTPPVRLDSYDDLAAVIRLRDYRLPPDIRAHQAEQRRRMAHSSLKAKNGLRTLREGS